MPNWTRVVFAVVFFGLIIGAHAYLYRRLVRDVTERRLIRLSALVGLGAIGIGAVVMFTRFRTSEGSVFSLALPLWFGLVVYMLFTLLLVDLLLWLNRLRRRAAPPAAPLSPERRLFVSRAIAATGVVAGGGLAAYGVFEAYQEPRITEVPVKLPRWPTALDGFTIVQLTDIHIGPVLREKFFDQLIGRANALKPDLMAVTGDLVDGPTRLLGPIVSRIRNLQGQYGTWFVTGNHDYYSGHEEWVAALENWGINVLRNRHVSIGDAGGSFDLVGVDDWGSRFDDGYDLSKATLGLQPDRASVLLAHQPSNFDEVARRGLGLQLSGHTHGGQTFPATGIARLIWGDRNTGLSQTGQSQLFVSRGCGFVGPPMRLGSPPEIIKLVLTS